MYSKGISWINDCRIPFVDEGDAIDTCKSDKQIIQYTKDTVWEKSGVFNYKRTGGNPQGRFPANILVSDDMLNDGFISKTIQKEKNITKKHNYNINFGVGEKYDEINDKGTNSRYYDIDKWFDKILE